MADPHIDTITNTKAAAQKITQFLYVDGMGRNGLKDNISIDDAIRLLQDIEENLYDNYYLAAKFLGWIES